MMYEFKYPNGITQIKKLISHEDYLTWNEMPESTDEEIVLKEDFWKGITNGKEWFTDKSPYYDAIRTGVINANGQHPVQIIATTF